MTGHPNQSINRKGEEVKEEGVTEVYTPKDPVNIDPKGPDMVDTTMRETVPMAIAEEEAEWDTPMDWVYLGHGEWSPPEEHNLHKGGLSWTGSQSGYISGDATMMKVSGYTSR